MGEVKINYSHRTAMASLFRFAAVYKQRKKEKSNITNLPTNYKGTRKLEWNFWKINRFKSVNSHQRRSILMIILLLY
jgi:hypothetical protein